ncbi:hypothetical protein DFJ73DRAFT_644050 [Zopfochytrium polystomum]|nr:hypothetical protein DFJ73DRAFT_644050 [Zopfochytrium polystomum]
MILPSWMAQLWPAQIQFSSFCSFHSWAHKRFYLFTLLTSFLSWNVHFSFLGAAIE